MSYMAYTHLLVGSSLYYQDTRVPKELLLLTCTSVTLNIKTVCTLIMNKIYNEYKRDSYLGT